MLLASTLTQGLGPRRHAAPTAQRLFSSPLAAMSIATGTRSTEPRIHWGTNCFAHPPGSTAPERAGQPSRRVTVSFLSTRAIARRLASRLEREGLIDKTDRQDLYPGLRELVGALVHCVALVGAYVSEPHVDASRSQPRLRQPHRHSRFAQQPHIMALFFLPAPTGANIRVQIASCESESGLLDMQLRIVHGILALAALGHFWSCNFTAVPPYCLGK